MNCELFVIDKDCIGFSGVTPAQALTTASFVRARECYVYSGEQKSRVDLNWHFVDGYGREIAIYNADEHVLFIFDDPRDDCSVVGNPAYTREPVSPTN